jgi:hypothetical protein
MGNEPKDEDDPLHFDDLAKIIAEMNSEDSSNPDVPPATVSEDPAQQDVPGGSEGGTPKA